MRAASGIARRIAGFTALLILAVAALGPAPVRAAPAVCTIGVSIESLHDLDMAADSFGADLWLWTVCPSSLPRGPLETIDFPTAGSLARDAAEVTVLGDGRTYASQRITGTFRFNWIMDDYPFDRQTVVIPIEESEYGADELVFEPDTAESFLATRARETLSQWRVSELVLTTRVSAEESAYGFPGAANPSYAAADATFVLERTSLVPFLKLTSGVLAAAFIAVFSFFYNPQEPGTFPGRLGLLVGVLFATLVNMRTADSSLGDIDDLTLVTRIHLVTLGFIALLAVLALHDRLRTDGGATLPHPHWRRITGMVVAYVLIVLGMILLSMLS